MTRLPRWSDYSSIWLTKFSFVGTKTENLILRCRKNVITGTVCLSVLPFVTFSIFLTFQTFLTFPTFHHFWNSYNHSNQLELVFPKWYDTYLLWHSYHSWNSHHHSFKSAWGCGSKKVGQLMSVPTFLKSRPFKWARARGSENIYMTLDVCRSLLTFSTFLTFPTFLNSDFSWSSWHFRHSKPTAMQNLGVLAWKISKL